MAGRKHDVITFKVDESLAEAMRGVPNRSEFIRNAILAALDSACPLCRGTGILTPNQQRHWERFSENHTLTECNDCHEMHLICEKGNPDNMHTHKVKGRGKGNK